MKATYLLFAFLQIMTACSDTSRKLNIPDTVEVTKTAQHQHIPGSRVFIIPPPGYTLSESNTLKKKDGSEIMIMDSQGKDFNEFKRPPDRPSETTFYEKRFILGGYKAIISYGKIKQETKEKIILLFGDAQFSCLVICEFADDNIVAREEVVTSLLTILLNKSLVLDYAALNKYSLDLTNSSFKFNKNINQIFCYTVNGEGEIEDNYISIVSLPALSLFEDMRNGSKELIKRLRNTIDIDEINEKVVSISGQPAYETIMKGTKLGKPQNIYLLIMGNARSSMYYLGVIEADKPALFEDCKALAQTIRLK